MIHNISDINLWELGTTISELQNKTWEQIKNNSYTRIRTKNLLPCSSSLKVKISSNYNIDLLWFNEEGLMISEIETNWIRGNNNEFISISVPNDAKQVGILVKFTDNSTIISPSEILNTNIYYDDGLLSNNSIIAENIINIMIGEIPALKMYFGNDLIWNSALPYDAEIEYLYVNSSKGCYIDTGIIPNANTGVYAKLYISHTNDEYIIGLRNDTTDTRWLIGHTDIGWYCGYGQSIFIEDNRQPYTDAIYEIELNFKNSGKMSNLTTNASKNLPILNFIPENSITIFKANCFDGALTNQSFMSASCRIYGVKISQGNDIIMDLIPVRVGLTGYMYDKISRLLFGNNGSGNFILGPDKLPPEYTKLEYISSTATGGQYIETNLNMWSVMPVEYEIDMRVNMLGKGKDNDNQAVIFGNNLEVKPWPGFVIRKEGSGHIEQDQFPKVSSYGSLGEILNIHQLYTVNETAHNVTATLFCGKNSNGTPFRYSMTRLYYCKLKANSSTWQRDFVPCLNPDGIAGLYDKVEGKFYSSPNGVAFEYGEVI